MWKYLQLWGRGGEGRGGVGQTYERWRIAGPLTQEYKWSQLWFSGWKANIFTHLGVKFTHSM